MGLENGMRLFYTRIEEDKYYLYQPLTLSYWAKDSIDNAMWEQKNYTIDYVIHKDDQTYISYGDDTFIGMQCTLGVKLIKFTPAAEALYGGKSN